jgi:ABC-type phosphate transport system substrate-binding protein
MRRTLTVCRHGLSVAAAVALLTACGGSGDSNSAASESSPTGSSASESSADAAGSEFCTQAAAVQERVAATFNGQSDPSTLPTTLQEAAKEIRAVDPPEELKSDWTGFADGIEQIAAAARVDFNDPNAVAAFQQKVADLQQQYGPAFSNVEKYLSEKCGLGGTPSGSAAPSS